MSNLNSDQLYERIESDANIIARLKGLLESSQREVAAVQSKHVALLLASAEMLSALHAVAIGGAVNAEIGAKVNSAIERGVQHLGEVWNA